MSAQAVLLLKWSSHGRIILAKYQRCHSYTFWTMPIMIISPVSNFGDQSLVILYQKTHHPAQFINMTDIWQTRFHRNSKALLFRIYLSQLFKKFRWIGGSERPFRNGYDVTSTLFTLNVFWKLDFWKKFRIAPIFFSFSIHKKLP